MITPQFTELYERLNTAQRKAVDTVEGTVMVIAGPGTGKTQVLTLRIANILLKTQVTPDNILALTFTESAVYEMRKRLVSIIGTQGYRVNINTFHGFCNEIIQNNSDHFDRLIASDNVTELEQIEIFESIILNNKGLRLLRPFGDQTYYIRPVMQAIGDLKKEGITPEVFENALNIQEVDFKKTADLYYESGANKGKMKGKYQDIEKSIEKNRELLVVFKAYEEMLRVRRKYDFNDMLLEVIDVFKKYPEVLLKFQEQYQYILVDEHQDTNAAQNKIVELLCNYFENPNLFIVGDEKQAIFRFQGASLENFLYFKTLYPSATLINLQENYRSSQLILDAASSMIKNNAKVLSDLQLHVELVARASSVEEKIRVVECNDFFGEYYCVADSIQKKLLNGVEPKNIVVLARNNKDLQLFVNVFEQKGVQYIIESDSNILKDLEIQKLILIFRVIQGIGSDADLVRAMHVDCLSIEPIDIYKLMDLASRKKISLWDLLTQDNYNDELQLKNNKAIKSFVEQIQKWKKDSHNIAFDDLFVDVLNKSCFLETVLKNKNSLQTIDKIIGLYEEIKLMISKNHMFSLVDFLKFIDLMETHNVSINKSSKTIYTNAVQLMTAHRSKGLEFDYVYVVNVFDGHWGNARKRGNLFKIPWEYLAVKMLSEGEELNEDERRLFYVAMTRAKKEVTISYSTRSMDGKEQTPSQFIGEISQELLISYDTEEFESHFLAHKEQILNPKKLFSSDYLQHKDFFAEIFKRRGLSVSGLNNYLDCPWRYFFRNLLIIPDVKNKEEIFGTAVHRALQLYIQYRGNSKNDFEFLMKSFNDALIGQPVNDREMQEMIEKGKNALPGFYEQKILYWKNELLSEMTIRGVVLTNSVHLNGKIDMIEKIKGSSDVIVHDFKTGKPKSRATIEGLTKNGNGAYKRQLIFYKILLDRYHNGLMRMKTGVIDFIEPNERGNYQSEAFDITDEEVKELEEVILTVSDSIINLAFWNDVCDDKECEYCRLRSFIGKI